MDTKLPIQPWELSAPYRNHPLVNKAGRRGEGEVRNGLSDFVKLRVHQLIDYAKVVFLDADIMVRGNVDHLFWLPEGSHSDGPHAPFNAGLVVVEPRKEDFRHLVAVVREGNFTDATGWRGEGGCASAGGCNARHVTQGLWDWFYRTSRPGGLRLPRDVYNGLQDEPAAGADPCLVHFTACGKPSTGACGKNPAVPMATGKKSPATATSASASGRTASGARARPRTAEPTARRSSRSPRPRPGTRSPTPGPRSRPGR